MSEGLKSNPLAKKEAVHHGYIYDSLEPGQLINIAILGDYKVLLDAENLGLDKVSKESLDRGWQKNQEAFNHFAEQINSPISGYEIYKFQRIQQKAISTLGEPFNNPAARASKYNNSKGVLPLSQTEGIAMCSEFAILVTYIAQLVGDRAHLICGSETETNDSDQWRESHAYVLFPEQNFIFDSVLSDANNGLPIMIPVDNYDIDQTLRSGYDIKAKMINSDYMRWYGLEAGGFGINTKK